MVVCMNKLYLDMNIRAFMLSLLLLPGHFLFCQTTTVKLPVNHVTGLVSIMDSINMGPKFSDLWSKGILDDWCNRTAFQTSAEHIYKPHEKKVVLGFTSIYDYEKRPGMFYRKGQLNLRSVKENGKIDTRDKANGSTSFNIVFAARKGYMVIEFTYFRFFSDNNELAKFEDPQVLSSDGVHFVPEEKMHWSRTRKEYYDRCMTLFLDLKRYIKNYTPYWQK